MSSEIACKHLFFILNLLTLLKAARSMQGGLEMITCGAQVRLLHALRFSTEIFLVSNSWHSRRKSEKAERKMIHLISLQLHG